MIHWNRPLPERGWTVLTLLPAVALVLSNLASPLHGSHLFRQAHVAANIETYLRDGISLHPRTYNLDVPFSLYDFPLYQASVVLVCRLYRFDPLVAARLLSALSFVLALAALWALMARFHVARMQRTLALVFFAYASLNLFYFQTPLVDTLAEACSFVSLAAFAAWNDTAAPMGWGLMSVTALAATLIKSPIELPVFVSTVWLRSRMRGWRGLTTAGMLAYGAVLAGAVVWFQLYENSVNRTPGLITPWEAGQYFGSVRERFEGSAWAPVLRTLAFLALNPITLLLALAGVVVWLVRSRSRRRAVFGGFLAGAIITLLLFFDRYRVHNYYLLPLVFPLSFFAAYAVQQCRVLQRARRRAGPRRLRAIGTAALGLSLVGTALFAWRGYAELSETDPSKLARGEWVRAQSAPDDFVVWVVGGDEDNWNPAFLYFAKRNGYNLNRARLDRAHLQGLYQRFAGPHRRMLLFCSDRLDTELVEGMGAHPLASEKARRLYLVDPSWLGASAVRP